MKILRNIFILFVPYLTIFFVNELVRPSIKENTYMVYGISTINSNNKTKKKCTWTAHESADYCKKNHVKFLKEYFTTTDKLYFGIINSLHSTGNYSYANIFFLAILIPIILWLSLIKIIDYSIEIVHLKRINKNTKL